MKTRSNQSKIVQSKQNSTPGHNRTEDDFCNFFGQKNTLSNTKQLKNKILFLTYPHSNWGEKWGDFKSGSIQQNNFEI
jgi:hypothetical protein